mmetsp:Transcript_40364/g.90602  ORF Transcript_40364/g.90602 Transcript_40364/m.90602 type:complete len:218 (-) Transcript_40364:650-1303(-)
MTSLRIVHRSALALKQPQAWLGTSAKTRQRLVVAVGGNALQRRGTPLTLASQLAAAAEAAPVLKTLASKNELVLTHGNGPQVSRHVTSAPNEPPLLTTTALIFFFHTRLGSWLCSAPTRPGMCWAPSLKARSASCSAKSWRRSGSPRRPCSPRWRWPPMTRLSKTRRSWLALSIPWASRLRGSPRRTPPGCSSPTATSTCAAACQAPSRCGSSSSTR